VKVSKPALALAGETDVDAKTGCVVMFSVYVANSVSSATLVAVIVMLVPSGTEGAVNRPFSVMVPALTDQVTAEFEAPVTVALNWSVAPGGKTG
jgi:hypothetical protein